MVQGRGVKDGVLEFDTEVGKSYGISVGDVPVRPALSP
jgi:hypothetical protein